jgi:hypothetical protein
MNHANPNRRMATAYNLLGPIAFLPSILLRKILSIQINKPLNMETLPVSKKNAVKAFREADQKGKALLKNLFGESPFNESITDRVKTFKDACEELGIIPDQMHKIHDIALVEDAKSIIAYAKLCIITRALNEGWKPDWSNSNETKFYPWFEFKSGVGFSFDDYGDRFSDTVVGSRLCFKSRELAEYAAKQFNDLYNEFFILN